ncbi:MAG TPA: MFS transporter [Bacteroidia bacterium]|nr:MFS transporter [Bacteroidia bacterium]
MKNFPLSKQIIYALGMMGWSMMINLIGVMLVYFYLPPNGAGLNVLVSQATFLGVFNIMAVILGSGRLFDAFYDPFIARMSDKSKSKRGRRIPFMLYSTLPSVIFCILVFFPPAMIATRSNAIWLVLTLTLFFVSTTTYAIPYNAMMPEIAKTSEDKVRLSSFQQVGFVFGIIISSQCNNIGDVMGNIFHLTGRVACLQYSVVFLAIIGGIAMLIPALLIDEKKYCHSGPSSTPIFKALKESFTNRNFIYFIIAYLTFFMALNLITNGLLYFVKVLAGIPESQGGRLIGFMVLLSLLFYPLVNYTVKKIGEKRLVLISFFILSFAFIGIAFIGRLPIDPKLQLYVLLGLVAFPLASLGILPNAILAGIIDEDVKRTGDNREGMYFAVNFFSAKLGQTLGLALFAMLTIYGKDPGHDMGLRMTGVSGCVLCAFAGLIFFGFKQQAK